MLALVVLALLRIPGLAAESTPTARGAVQPPTSIVDSARAATASFNWVWRFYWEVSDLRSLSAAIWPPPPPDKNAVGPKKNQALVFWDPRRRRLLHCHPDGEGGFGRPDTNIIRSGWGNRAICPSWMMSAGPAPWDERLGIDAQIRPELISGLRIARDSLLTLLDQAAAKAPADDWVAGERVRFALDQGDTTRALAAAIACRAQAGWCAALQAYVHYGRHEIVRADSEFQAAVRLLPASDRCEWTDLSDLLGPGSGAYGRIPCERRDSVNDRIWWLSAPMYTEPANERRAEHYAREVETRLRATDTPAERWDWSEGDGGRAIRQMMIRYGWPAFSYWLGHDEDREHFHYLGVGVVPIVSSKDSITMSAGIFTTAEYPLDRYHTVPLWSAIDDPWHADAADWTVWSPPVLNTDSVNVGFWPWEHTPHFAGPLVQLADQQTGLFRRDTAIMMAVATDLGASQMARAGGDTIDGVLIMSPGPGAFRFQRQPTVVGTTVVMRTLISSEPEIIGVEYPGRSGEPSARIRFGITPPPPLSTLQPHEIAISSPVLIHATPSGAIPETTPGPALTEMFGSTTFAKGGRLGVYWETYGVNGGDTVDVSVRITPRSTPSLPRRLGAWLRILPSASNSVTVVWREPSPGHFVTTIPGPHPIQGRNVNIDLSQLDPGSYTLEVGVARPRGVSLFASRAFTLLQK